jgi:hypothetical protein
MPPAHRCESTTPARALVADLRVPGPLRVPEQPLSGPDQRRRGHPGLSHPDPRALQGDRPAHVRRRDDRRPQLPPGRPGEHRHRQCGGAPPGLHGARLRVAAGWDLQAARGSHHHECGQPPLRRPQPVPQHHQRLHRDRLALEGGGTARGPRLLDPSRATPPFRPKDTEDNKIQFDRETIDVQFAGLFYGDSLPGEHRGELFVFGLYEDDTDRRPTRNRQLVTPGFRFWKPPPGARWIT